MMRIAMWSTREEYPRQRKIVQKPQCQQITCLFMGLIEIQEGGEFRGECLRGEQRGRQGASASRMTMSTRVDHILLYLYY